MEQKGYKIPQPPSHYPLPSVPLSSRIHYPLPSAPPSPPVQKMPAPVEPQEPEAPQEPQEPQEPEVSEDPEAPEDPEDPEDPEQPQAPNEEEPLPVKRVRFSDDKKPRKRRPKDREFSRQRDLAIDYWEQRFKQNRYSQFAGME